MSLIRDWYQENSFWVSSISSVGCLWVTCLLLFQIGRVSIYKEVWLGFLLPTPSPVQDREDLTRRGRSCVPQAPWSPSVCPAFHTHRFHSLCVCLLHLAMSRDLVPESSCRNLAVGDILVRGRAAIAGAGWNNVLTWCSSPGQRPSPKERPKRRGCFVACPSLMGKKVPTEVELRPGPHPGM